MTRSLNLRPLPLALVLCLTLGRAGEALDRVEFDVPGADKATVSALKSASALLGSGKVTTKNAQDLFADARAEYGRLIQALYGLGYYGPVIHVWVNGKEAAEIAPLDAPNRITSIKVEVETGPLFHFGSAEVTPLAPRTRLPPEFHTGAVALSSAVQAAATAGVDGWRAQGHAKATVADQSITADHAAATLSVLLGIDPGPVLRFGTLTVTGAERMRVNRILKIAGLTPGLRYDPAEIARAADRLRRSGIFSSVTLTEDDRVTPPDILGVTAQVVEAPLHRYSFGAEVTSQDGTTLTGSWLHRNLFGGGERLTITGDISNIAARSSGLDWSLGATLDRPATPGADTSAGVFATLGHQDDTDYQADTFDTGLTFAHYFDDKLTGTWGVAYGFSRGRDGTGDFLFRTLNLPVELTWDNRNSITDPTRGVYLDGKLTPFMGFGTTDDGAQVTFDARGYKTVGANRALTFAARLQGGAVLFSDILRTPREDLFYSGGGGTVRGQPYQSLGAHVLRGGTTVDIGGTTFLGTSMEARYRINDTWGAVGFFDAGLVSIGDFTPTSGNWQSGAGLGLRYETGFGPVRLDVAVPVHGGTPGDWQLYVGLGQAF